MTRAKALAVAFLAIACLAATLVYAVRFRWSVRGDAREGASALSSEALLLVAGQPRMYFRNTRLDDTYGRLVGIRLNDPEGGRAATGLACDRLDVAGGTGVCLTASRGVLTTYSAVIFDEQRFEPRKTLTLGGIPSRVRVSPDGRIAGITVFVSGHSYSQSGFSTHTTLVATDSGDTLADLETFAVERGGRPFRQQDFNFWGVTFASDSNTFYATLSSGGVNYLIRGDATTRRATVIAEDVECPSLSPDNRRVAFKARERRGGQLIWRLSVLDLTEGTRALVAGETRSVDDQVEWLDDRRILYSTPSTDRPGSMTVSVADVDAGTAATLLADAYSPSIP